MNNKKIMKNPHETALEAERKELERVQAEAKMRMAKIKQLEAEAEKSRLDYEIMEEAAGLTFQDLIDRSGYKEKAIMARLHMTTPTFSKRKGKGAANWRLDEIKTLADKLNMSVLFLVAVLIQDVKILPEDKEEARLLRQSYN
jgi:hypothetical protein